MNEDLERRKLLLRLAEHFENRERNSVTFTGESSEETTWLRREFARLSSEGSVSAGDPGASPGYRLTTVGYNKYLAQITAWRHAAPDLPPKTPDLSRALLNRMMRQLGEWRSLPFNAINTARFEPLLEEGWARERCDERKRYVNRHIEFLEQSGYVSVMAKLGDEDWAGVRLTVNGQKFVQPALAEFGEKPLLPEVVKSIEAQIHTLTRPLEEKESLLFRLREAVTKQAPDLIVKFLVELASKIVKP